MHFGEQRHVTEFVITIGTESCVGPDKQEFARVKTECTRHRLNVSVCVWVSKHAVCLVGHTNWSYKSVGESREKRKTKEVTNLMSLVLLFHHLLLNMFRMLVHPSSGACDLL